MSDEKADKQDLAHYSATVAAWFNTRLEHDKSLLTLSSAAIGLLISVVAKISFESTLTLTLYIAALAAFIVCLISVLSIYKRNSQYLEDLIAFNSKNDIWLAVFDQTAYWGFIAGIVISSSLGIYTAITSFESKEMSVATHDKSKAQTPIFTGDSFNRALNTRPSAQGDQRSFNGAANTKAPAPVSTQTTAPAPVAPQNAGEGKKP